MCEHENCKLISFFEIREGVRVVIHYNLNLNPVFIQYIDDSKHINKEFFPHLERELFPLTLEDVKNTNFDLTEIFTFDY